MGNDITLFYIVTFLELVPISPVIKKNRLRWLGRVECKNDGSWVKQWTEHWSDLPPAPLKLRPYGGIYIYYINLIIIYYYYNYCYYGTVWYDMGTVRGSADWNL